MPLRRSPLTFIALGVATACLAAPVPKEGNPFATCKDKFPDGVREAYLKFLALRLVKEPEDELKKLLLPGMVRITTEKRKEGSEFYGDDLNVPFFLEDFNPKVFFVRKLSDDVYRLQTQTTSITFVQTKSGGWLICQYLDNPPE